jgi:hypothetical protein
MSTKNVAVTLRALIAWWSGLRIAGVSNVYPTEDAAMMASTAESKAKRFEAVLEGMGKSVTWRSGRVV